MQNQPIVQSIFIGGPKTIHDDQGTWRTSIFRDPVSGPVAVEVRGLAGDQATQPYHGTPEQAVCCHLQDHYRFWQAQYGLELEPGSVGENFTLAHVSEAEICIGDIYRAGTAVFQVSAPRIPCHNQARRVGRADWVALTLKELRPGFYMRVLEAGQVEPGDPLQLAERPNPDGSLLALNRCCYETFTPQVAQRFAAMPGLMPWWRERLLKKLG